MKLPVIITTKISDDVGWSQVADDQRLDTSPDFDLNAITPGDWKKLPGEQSAQ